MKLVELLCKNCRCHIAYIYSAIQPPSILALCDICYLDLQDENGIVIYSHSKDVPVKGGIKSEGIDTYYWYCPECNSELDVGYTAPLALKIIHYYCSKCNYNYKK